MGTLGTMAQAQDATTTPPPTPPNYDAMTLGPLYRAQEVSVDMFGAGTIGEHTLEHLSGNRLEHRGEGGGGVGLDYFFCRYLGVDAETFTMGDEPFIYSASGNLILRFPIAETGLAPYIFGGGGYQFDYARQDFGQAGVGVEFRFTHNIGLFADTRYVMADQTENYAEGRAGLRITF